jgi:hypothetical protein
MLTGLSKPIPIVQVQITIPICKPKGPCQTNNHSIDASRRRVYLTSHIVFDMNVVAGTRLRSICSILDMERLHEEVSSIANRSSLQADQLQSSEMQISPSTCMYMKAVERHAVQKKPGWKDMGLLRSTLDIRNSRFDFGLTRVVERSLFYPARRADRYQ